MLALTLTLSPLAASRSRRASWAPVVFAAAGDALLELGAPVLLMGGLDGAPVLHLEAHCAGRARYVLSCDTGRRICIFTENGTRPSPVRTGLLLFPTSGARRC